MSTGLRDLAEQAIHDSRLPGIVAERCVHSLIEDASCSACLSSCPKNAWQLNDEALLLNKDVCDGCNLCVPACPQGAITRSETLSLLKQEDHSCLLLACDKSGVEDSSLVISCIHSIGLADLLLAQRQGVRLILVAVAKCEECSRGNCVRLGNRLHDLNRALHSRGLPELSLVETSAQIWHAYLSKLSKAPRGPAMGRREFFSGLFSQSIEEYQTFLQLSGSRETTFIPPGKLLPVSSGPQPWPFLPEMDSKRCDGCSACARLCPHDAIRFEQAESGPEFQIIPLSCTGCAICEDVCQLDAIEIKHWKVQEQYALLLQASTCRACGVTFHLPKSEQQPEPDSLCPICRQRDHYKNLYQVLD